MRSRVLLAVLVVLVVVAAIVAARPHLLRPDIRPSAFKADVLVVGGSPAGVAAALAAARQGMVVVLTEPRPFLGTVWTGAMLNMVDLSRFPGRREQLIHGIFAELYQQIGGITFDPRRVRAILQDKVEAEPGITLLLRTELVRPVVESGRLRGAVVRLPERLEVAITATVTIDATDDADLAAAAGVPYTYGRETSGLDRRAMPATLMFRLADVDWSEVTRYALANRRGRQPSGAFNGYAWGYRKAMRDYLPSDPILSAQDLNIGRLPDGTVLINALQVHAVDGTSRASRLEGYERAKREIPRLVDYIRRNCPGFARARLVEVAPELYIRETRHIRGLYVMTARDIAERTIFWDRVAAASYPVDLHQYKQGERYPYRPVRQPYTIPLRSLIASRIDGVLVASRAFSATYQAAGSARVVPTTIAMGQAAGTAAAVAVLSRVTPHALADRRDLVREVQRRLVRDGATIEF